MQFPVNPNLYNGGAVVFNTAPFAQFYLQQQAKRQAKQEALNKYYDDQAKAITPTGMRAKDIEGGWSNKFQQWQELGTKNRENLLRPTRDGYKTLNEFNRLANELKSDIEKSKQLAGYEKELREYKMSGKWNPTDDDMAIADDVGKSIYDPNKKWLGLDALSVNVPDLDLNKFVKDAVGQNKRDKMVVGEPKFDSAKGTQAITYEERFSPQTIRSIADSALAFAQRPDVRKTFSHALESDDLPSLQQAYETVYPGKMVTTPEQAAQAYIIRAIGAPTGRSEEVKSWTDPNRSFNQQKELARIRHGYALSEIDHRNLKKKVEEQGGANSYIQKLIDDAQPGYYKNADGTIREVLTLKSTAADRKMFTTTYYNKDGQKREISPDYLQLTKDKKHIIPVFLSSAPDRQGKAAVDKQLSQPVLLETFAARLGKELAGTTVNKDEFEAPYSTGASDEGDVEIESLRNKYGY